MAANAKLQRQGEMLPPTYIWATTPQTTAIPPVRCKLLILLEAPSSADPRALLSGEPLVMNTEETA